MMTKVCKVCGVEKPTTEYKTVARGKLGCDTTCKKCVNAIRSEQRKSMAKIKFNTKGIPRGVGFGNTPQIEIDSEIFQAMIYEVKNKTIIIKSGKNKIEVKFQYVDAFAKELQEIKNTYFGIRI